MIQTLKYTGFLQALVKLGFKLGKRSWWLTAVLWLVAIAPARAELDLRVSIERDVPAVQIGSNTASVLKDGSGRVLGQLPQGTSLIATPDTAGLRVNDWQLSAVWLEPQNGGFVYIDNPNDNTRGRYYRGRVLVVPTSSGLTAVNYVDLEEYLYSVVGSEMPASWHLEALKAQAVAARTYALYQRQTSGNTVFDVGNTTRWQAYGGAEKEASSTIAAVRATRGQVLTYNGQLINAVYHSSSGGHTENSEDVWVSPLPYLRGVPDYDQAAPVFQWTETFTAEQMRQRITGVGNILRFELVQASPNQRLRRVRVVGDAGSRELTGDQMRQALNLRSTLFTIQPQAGQVASAQGAAAPPSFQVTGRGFGHGIGMSQYGAFGMASQGSSYRDIVTHYYRGAILSRIRVQ
ncbi:MULTISPECIES: SpoIID/LytB domain-containing protein [Cyanophyceae]|uniref:SpoIID/LytB domain-containing protein n=1 Tax=Cyanophyceae TaxID=3028117 RepID=UPI00074D3064|nr:MULTISPECIES: SpoIID/LytB domain-containing protein [Cyanophyceae]BAU43263.1 Amidase enhancer precursor [Leptolyngbya sp. O-77]